MFDVQFMVGETVADTPTPLTIIGTHGREREFRPGTAIKRGELDTLPDVANRLWPNADIPAGLLQHVLIEALQSDLILGDSPEKYSPLGDVRPDSAGRWMADGDLADAAGPLSVRVQTSQFTTAGSPVLEFVVDDEVVSALAFGADAVVIPVRPGVDTVELIESLPGFLDDAGEVLRATVPGADLDELMVWRLYTGDNSLIRDAVSRAARGIHRLTLRGLDRVGILVGRTVKVAAKLLTKEQGDPFAARRLRKDEAQLPDVTETCPRLDELAKQTEAVVAVHGTMSTGLVLAAAIQASNKPLPVITRFEHDTWLPIGRNAETLANLVQARISNSVLFVAHSRGGLVARHAADLLRGRAPRTGESQRTIELIALGTPFLGTPTADVATVGFRGVQALMGGLRWAGLPVVNPLTRLAGLAIKSAPPQGITDMAPRPGYLSGFTLYPPTATRTFAGRVTERGGDHHGFLHGFSRGLMGEVPNDLVVPEESAAGGVEDTTTLECDHFSYLEQRQVQNAIYQSLGRLPHIHAARHHERLQQTAERLPKLTRKPRRVTDRGDYECQDQSPG
ncbi:hypothetical protein [Amycolatopsis sp. NPDC004169]|uniref:alpha/beta hydrolase n=1 Tax=Amycolatopsis sp. NPDC004169 TaxID=3154453 RepID=UPI0033B2F223